MCSLLGFYDEQLLFSDFQCCTAQIPVHLVHLRNQFVNVNIIYRQTLPESQQRNRSQTSNMFQLDDDDDNYNLKVRFFFKANKEKNFHL